jgi:hypothetical protein
MSETARRYCLTFAAIQTKIGRALSQENTPVSARPGLTTEPENGTRDKLRFQTGFGLCLNNTNETLYRIWLALTGHSITAK